MKMYLVLWAGKYDTNWSYDGLYATPEHAQAKITLEQLDHPSFRHTVIEIDAPSLITDASAEVSDELR